MWTFRWVQQHRNSSILIVELKWVMARTGSKINHEKEGQTSKVFDSWCAFELHEETLGVMLCWICCTCTKEEGKSTVMTRVEDDNCWKIAHNSECRSPRTIDVVERRHLNACIIQAISARSQLWSERIGSKNDLCRLFLY